MEGANESGRKAANAILDLTGSTASRAKIFTLWENPALVPIQKTDALLYKAGLPNLLDIRLPGRF